MDFDLREEKKMFRDAMRCYRRKYIRAQNSFLSFLASQGI